MNRRAASAVVPMLAALLLAASAPAIAQTEPQGAAPTHPLSWRGTVDISVQRMNNAGETTWNTSVSFSNLVPGDGFGGYWADFETSGVFYDNWVWDEYCPATGEDEAVTYTWTDEFQQSPWSPNWKELLIAQDEETGALSLTMSPILADGVKSGVCAPYDPPSRLVNATGTSHEVGIEVGALVDSSPDPLLVQGTTTHSSSGEGFSLDWQATYDLEGYYCSQLPGDADGDRLPDDYETDIIGADPSKCDSDDDGWWDAEEVASGSSPMNAAETPDTLSKGKAPADVTGKDDVGITCGKTKFAWMSPALKPLGVAKGKRGCIMLLSNDASRGILEMAFSDDAGSVTSALQEFITPHIQEIHGEEVIDYGQEALVDGSVWVSLGLLGVKQGMLRAFNMLAKSNAAFNAGTIAGLFGVSYGALWKVNQVVNKKACIQARIGLSADGQANLSWSLVYNKQGLTEEGLKDGLHRAGVWMKKVVDGGVDRAVRKSINLTCDGGKAAASGGSAGAVFDSAISDLF